MYAPPSYREVIRQETKCSTTCLELNKRLRATQRIDPVGFWLVLLFQMSLFICDMIWTIEHHNYTSDYFLQMKELLTCENDSFILHFQQKEV